MAEQPLMAQNDSWRDTVVTDRFQFKLATWNTWLIPVLPYFPGCLDRSVPKRAEQMIEWIKEEVLNKGDLGLDIICLQEVRTFLSCEF